MKFPVVELIDRYAISQVKFKKLNGINADEVEFYKQQLESEYDLEKVQSLIEGLVSVHSDIWGMEDDFKKVRLDGVPMDEIGRRALAIRDLNNTRIAFKNQIAERLGDCVLEHKSYAGQKSITFPDFYNTYDYSDRDFNIIYLDYSHDYDDGTNPDFEYKYIKHLQNTKGLRDTDVIILNNPYNFSFLQSPLVAYLNWFYENHPNPLVYITSTQTVPSNVKFPVYTDLFHEHATQFGMKDYVAPVKMERHKKVMYTSSKDYPARRHLYKMLHEHHAGEANLAYSALATNYDWDNYDSPMNQEINTLYSREFINNVRDMPYIPTPVLGETVDFHNLPHKYYNETYLNVVMDTLYGGTHPVVFYSEKVFNAIAHRQLFLYAGTARSLRVLREAGYHVFEEIFDLNYDDIGDDEQRTIEFTNSVRKFINRPISDIQRDYATVFHKIEENYQRYQRSVFSDKIDRAVQLALESKHANSSMR